MTLVLVRHGEPDYTPCEERGYIGHGMDLAPLTEAGRAQAEEAAKDSRLDGAEFILASPYTRAMQTAAIIARRRDLDIRVEVDLHEWMPDLTFQYRSWEESGELYDDFCKHRGVYPDDQTRNWESMEMMKTRLARCLDRYAGYNKLIAVCHGAVIGRLVGQRNLPYCSTHEIIYNKGHRYFDWVD